jgi:hypothetical protein
MNSLESDDEIAERDRSANTPKQRTQVYITGRSVEGSIDEELDDFKELKIFEQRKGSES